MFPPSRPTPTFPYQLEAKIGEGAMGVVYRAVEPQLGRRVAIKVLRIQGLAPENHELAHEFLHRFIQEARAAASLSHPGVTTIYRVGEESGVPYIAMEWLEGKTLERMLVEEPRLAPARVAHLGAELLEALDAAHRAGVVHRDVKPSNLVVLEDGRMKVTDFGIARVQGSELVKTQPGLVLATPQFAAPEQLSGSEIDGRCDVFSAGVVLYLALTGRYPFEGANVFEIVSAIAHKEPIPPSRLAPGVSPALEATLLRAIRKDRADRFRTAGEMAAALRSCAAALSTNAAAAGYAPDEAPTVDNLPNPFVTQAGVPVPASSASTVSSDTDDTLRAPACDHAVPAYPALLGFPGDPHEAVATLVSRWPARSLGLVTTASLVDKLLEKPLHTAPFAGGLFVNGKCLLIANGFVLGAVEPGSDATSDEVCEWLPEAGEATLHPVPEFLPPEFVVTLASLLHPSAVRLADIDSSIVNLAALSRKLEDERFDGLLRLSKDGATGFVFFDKGRTVLSIFSEGWGGYPVDQSWESWASRASLRACLEERTWNPAFFSYRRELRDFAFRVRPTGDVAKKGKTTSGLKILQQLRGNTARPESVWHLTPDKKAGTPGGDAALEGLYSQDPIYRFMRWGLDELPAYFRERERSNKWKYLAEWLTLVREAVLHHDLARPDSRDTDFFDLVTTDGKGKVLHLGQRVAVGSPESLGTFLDRVVRAKAARIKTGDVGGAFLIAPSFEGATVEAYRAATKPDVTSKTIFGMEERLTGYEGFVRIGPRRGFHLLLIAETATGFEPVLL
jgi:serine/threonine protein kinase